LKLKTDAIFSEMSACCVVVKPIPEKISIFMFSSHANRPSVAWSQAMARLSFLLLCVGGVVSEHLVIIHHSHEGNARVFIIEYVEHVF